MLDKHNAISIPKRFKRRFTINSEVGIERDIVVPNTETIRPIFSIVDEKLHN